MSASVPMPIGRLIALLWRGVRGLRLVCGMGTRSGLAAGITALLLALGGSCASAAEDHLKPLAEWIARQSEADPLAGQIFDARAGAMRTPERLPLDADVLLLGEVHDNPAHHWVRGLLITAIAEKQAPRRPAIVMEHVAIDQQPGLDQFAEFTRAARRLATPQDFFRAVAWDASGWPDQKLFEPMMAAIIRAGLPIIPGNAAKDMVRALARGDTGQVGPVERQRLRLDQPLAPPLADALLTELEASHCGLMPKSAFGGMADAQRYRDAQMADALSTAAAAHGRAILLAGNGHVRTDRGVPAYLPAPAPGQKRAAIMLLEVESGRSEPADYVPMSPDGKPAVDWIIFTSRAERKDPCVEMREGFRPKK